MIKEEEAEIESIGECMRNMMLIVGTAILLLSGCSDQSAVEVLHKEKTEMQADTSSNKQEQKLVPEVKVVGENGIGAGIIVKKESSMLYIVTNGALVASKPTALIQFSNDEYVEAEVRYIATAYNVAILQVKYKASVNVPTIYNGKLDFLAVYVDTFPYTIKKYDDKVAAYYIDVDQALPPGSPVIEAEKGQIVGIYFNRQEQGVSQPYILPLQDIAQLLDKWIADGMKATERLSQSKNLYAYREDGDKEAVQQAIEKYGKNVFAYNEDEVKIFIDAFHEHLQAAVAMNDASVMKSVTGTEDLQHMLEEMVTYYVSKQAKIHFSNTSIKHIEKVGQKIVVRAKTEYVLTNSAGQEVLVNAMMTYEMIKNDQGEYQLIRLTAEE